MSCSPDGKHLFCDAPNCLARTDAPVVLQSSPADVQERWLYVQRGGIWQHFCPAHSGSALFAPGDAASASAPSALHKLLVVVDNSEAARFLAEQIAQRLLGLTVASVTLLFSACARCMPIRETNNDAIPLEAYCPGTRSAIAKLTVLFEMRNVRVSLNVQPTPQISECLAQESAQTKYDAVLVCIPRFPFPIVPSRNLLPLLPTMAQVA